MEIPIILFFGFIASFFAFFVLGLVSKKPVMSIITGVLLLSLTLATDEITVSYSDTIIDDNMDLIAEQTSRTGAGNVHNGTGNLVIRAEHITSSSSQLYGDTVNCLELYVSKTGSPSISTPVILGVFSGTVANGIAETKYEFGRVNVTNITTNAMLVKECNISSDYTFVVGDRVGIMYRAGDASNFISDQEDTTDPFDSTVTRGQSFNDATNVWANIASNDLHFILTLEHEATAISEPVNYEFTEFPKMIFALFSALLMLVGAIMWRIEQTGDYPFDY